MEDDELAQIRARRLAELQGQGGGGGGGSSQVAFFFFFFLMKFIWSVLNQFLGLWFLRYAFRSWW
jgi:hypothetical protein